MAQFSQQSIERVRESSDIVEIVSAYTELRRVGERFTGLCPFHDERSPSFSVDARDKLYHCFGCGVGGDVFDFVREKEGLPFPEAVESLADRYGVEVEREEEDPKAEETRKRRARLAELLDRTGAFYAEYLWSSDEAAKARRYLLERGLEEEALRAFGVGYAPSAWDAVLKRGQAAGYSVDELRAAGLAQKSQKSSGFYDRFRARITFPIRDARGRMQGFGARALRPDQKPKYVNSAEGELYRKSRTLYAIDRARGAIAKSGAAIVVEGYTDVIACHQAGMESAIAVMGTAITPEQVQMLAGFCDEVVLAMDADRAGREAMLRAQRVATGKRVRLRVAAMPPGEDPADALTAGGESADRFRALVEGAVDLPVFHVRTLLDEADTSSPSGRDQALDEVLPVLGSMTDSMTRDELVREVGGRLDANPALVAGRLKAQGASRPAEAPARRASTAANGAGEGASAAPKRPPRPLNAHEQRELALLAMCVAAPVPGRDYLRRLTPGHLSSPAIEKLRAWLMEHLDDPAEGLPRDDEELSSAVARVVVISRREPADAEAMELNFLQLELAQLERRIDEASGAGGDPPLELITARAHLLERISGRVA